MPPPPVPPPPDPQYVWKVRLHALSAHFLPPSISRVVHAVHVTASSTLFPVSAVHADGIVQEVPPPHSMWTVKVPEQSSLELELVGVCLSAIMPSSSAELEYLTYMSAILELLNAIFPIVVAEAVTSPQLPPKENPFQFGEPLAASMVVQAGGSPASVPDKHANPMAQSNTEASFFGNAAHLPHIHGYSLDVCCLHTRTIIGIPASS